MKYVVMYLVCGSLWITWMFNYYDVYECINGEEATQIFKETKRELFKSTGIDFSFDYIRKAIVILVFAFFVVTWPYQLFDTFVITKIKLHIKK